MKKKAVVFVGGVFLILLVAVFVYGGPVMAQIGSKAGCGTIPDGSSLKPIPRGIYNVEGMNIQAFIYDGMAMGEPSNSSVDQREIIPACYSNLEGFQILRSLKLVDKEGNKYTLYKGVGSIGEGGSPPLP